MPSPPTRTRPPSTQKDLRRGKVVVGSVACLVLGVAWLSAFIVFGSVQAALAWANGHSVFVSPPVAELEVEAGKTIPILFHIQKLSSQPVRVVGATPGCSCVVVSGLPLDLTDVDNQLEVKFSASERKVGQVVEQQIPLHLNVDAAPAVLRVRARVNKSLPIDVK